MSSKVKAIRHMSLAKFSVLVFVLVALITTLFLIEMGPGFAMPTSATDETKVPHYFGPYPNWANSPQVLADAIVTIGLGTPTPVSFGNPLVGRAYATDFATAPGTLGPVFVVLPSAALPAGTLQSFQIWNQADAGRQPHAVRRQPVPRLRAAADWDRRPVHGRLRQRRADRAGARRPAGRRSRDVPGCAGRRRAGR